MNDIDDEIEEGAEVTEETEFNEEDFRPLSKSEDIELDVLESLEELREKAAQEEQKQGAEAPQPVKQPTQGVGKQGVTQQNNVSPGTNKQTPSQPEVIQPPSDWSVKSKEWFNRQPPEAKQELAKRAYEMNRHFHEVTSRLSKREEEFKDLDEAIRPYQDKWQMLGVSRGEAIKSLAAANAYLEQDLAGGLDFIARSYGTTLEDIIASRGQGSSRGQSQQSQGQSQNIDLLNLTNEINMLKAELNRGKEQEQESQQQALLDELWTVRDETDSQGRYLRPELHDDSFVERLAPLMQGLAQTMPDRSPREWLAQAYFTVTGKNPQSQPVNNRGSMVNQHRQNAERASLSVRGSSTSPARPVSRDNPNSRASDDVMQIAKEIGYI